MSGFASKISAASTKGWKDFQSLWTEPKTTLSSADTSPGEKSSLLGQSSYGSGGGSQKGNLLGDDNEDSWGDWGHDSDWSSSKKASKENSSEWTAGSEEDLEAWLNDDTSALSGKPAKGKKKPDDDWSSWKTTDSGSRSSSAKSSSSTTSKPKKNKYHKPPAQDGWEAEDWGTDLSSSNGRQKKPLVGNLINLDDGKSGGRANSGADNGWDNEVWADEDDENDWQTLDLDDNKLS